MMFFIEKAVLNTPAINHTLTRLGIMVSQILLSRCQPAHRPCADKLGRIMESLYLPALIGDKKQWISVPRWKYRLLLKIVALSEHKYTDTEKEWMEYLERIKGSALWQNNMLLRIVDCALATSYQQDSSQVINKHTVDLFFECLSSRDKLKSIF